MRVICVKTVDMTCIYQCWIILYMDVTLLVPFLWNFIHASRQTSDKTTNSVCVRERGREGNSGQQYGMVHHGLAISTLKNTRWWNLRDWNVVYFKQSQYHSGGFEGYSFNYQDFLKYNILTILFWSRRRSCKWGLICYWLLVTDQQPSWVDAYCSFPSEV